MKILVIDNYDSFTYNLVHYIHNITDKKPDVYRNDEIGLADVGAYDKILLSPGPGVPEEAGICLELIRQYGLTKSIFGVCLGLQAIGEAYGGKLTNLDKVYHGVATSIRVLAPDDPIYRGLPPTFMAGRYHSWVVSRNELPSCLFVTSEDESGMIMGMSHTQHNVRGVQFHPESVLTDHGMKMIENWLSI